MSSGIGLAAILVLLREARPLKQLAAAVEEFSASLRLQALPNGYAREVKSLVQAFDLMQKRIIALLEGRTFILGAVSHDLKTYVTRLRLRVEAIDAEDKRAKAISDIEEMASLIDNALDLTRQSLVSLERSEVDIATLLREEIEHFVEAEGVVRLAAIEPAVMSGDAVALRRLVANLLDNAMKFGTVVSISLGRSDSMIELIVDDNGPGIPEDERANIFEPFYRLEKSRNRKTGGAGLGLAIADAISRAHGGSIRAEASPLGGARIVISLPC
jgi:signal transduction histidine kinase